MEESFGSDEIAVKEIVNEDETEIKCVTGVTGGDDHLRSHQDEVAAMAGSQSPMDSDDATSMKQIQNSCMIQIIDNVPYPKEERKGMSVITARMCSFVHNCNWTGLRQYDSVVSNDAMRQAAAAETEQMLLRCYDINQIWTEDLKEDHKLEESLIKYFWLWPGLSYAFALLRSNAEFGTCFLAFRVDENQLVKAKSCLDKLKSESESLTPRATLNYYMAWGDYYLRCAQIKPDSNSALLSYSMAANRIEKCQRMLDENPGLFIRGEKHRVNVRQKYIKETCGDDFVSSSGCAPDMNYSMDSLQTQPKMI